MKDLRNKNSAFVGLSDEQIRNYLLENPDGEGQKFLGNLLPSLDGYNTADGANGDGYGVGDGLGADGNGNGNGLGAGLSADGYPATDTGEVIVESWDQGVKGGNKGTGGMKRRKVITKVEKRIMEVGIDGKYRWPYSDSYAPELRLIRDDMVPIKDRLYRKN